MASAPLSAAAQAARLTALIAAGTKSGAASLLSGVLDASENTIRGWLSGRSIEDAKADLRALMAPAAPEPGVDQMIEEAAASLTAERLKRQLREALERIDEIATIRRDCFGLTERPLRPAPLVAQAPHPESLAYLLGIFDAHLGKAFDRAFLRGLQDYNVKIAVARVGRAFTKAAHFIERDGAPPAKIVVALGGDNVNGELRHDDTASNEIPPISQARVFAQTVVSGLDMLLDRFPDVQIEVLGLPGNHGRTTPKPPSVNLAENYDSLAAMLVEWHFRGEDRIRVCVAETPDLTVHFWRSAALVTHGDRIGSNGGDGQLGALGPTKRGSLKIERQYSEMRDYVEGLPELAVVLMGHYHTHWTDLFTFSSGALCGPDVYSSDKLRAPPRPPYQWLLGFHPEAGLVKHETLFVGHKSEGPICARGGS